MKKILINEYPRESVTRQDVFLAYPSFSRLRVYLCENGSIQKTVELDFETLSPDEVREKHGANIDLMMEEHFGVPTPERIERIEKFIDKTVDAFEVRKHGEVLQGRRKGLHVVKGNKK